MPMPPGRKPHPPLPSLSVARRRSMVSDLYLRSMSLQRIATRLDIPVRTVRKDVRKLLSDWQKSAQKDIRSHKGRELQRLNRIEFEAWKAWERSKGPGKLADGNAAFLRLVLDLVGERAKLLGLHAPKQAKLDVNVGQRVEWLSQIDQLSAEEIAKGRSPAELRRAHRAQVAGNRPLQQIGLEEDRSTG